MRVVGGEWRGRRLVAPAGRATRPTSDKVREAIFDVLVALLLKRGAAAELRSAAAPLAGQVVLDLFAGSGALGIEALSRGAARCTFVERSPAALRALRTNVEAVMGCAGEDAGRARILASAARAALQADARAGNLYTLVFVDPPYARYAEYEEEIAEPLLSVLAPSALVVVETGKGQPVRLPLGERSVKVYGDTQVTFSEVEA